jgi:hypothetical protein
MNPFSPHLPTNALLFFISSALFLFGSRFLKDPPEPRKGEVHLHGGFGLVQELPRVLMQVLLSLLLVTVAIKMIMSLQYDQASKHWAYGVIGTVLGFWLRSK